jgi:hydroxyacylglutathione hydrolase
MKVGDNFHFLYGLFSANVGIIVSEDEMALVDSAWVMESVDHVCSHIEKVVEGRKLKYVFVTHTDPDHIGGLQRLKNDYNPKIVIHKSEVQFIENPRPPIAPAHPDIIVDGDETFEVGRLKLELMHTPGHSEGSCSIFNREHGVLFAGDTVFPEGFYLPYTGRLYQIPNIKQSISKIVDSLRRLRELNPKWILPGHGRPIQGGQARITENIHGILTLKEQACELLRTELSISELAEKLDAFPVRGFALAQTHPVSIGVSHHLLFAERVVEELMNEKKIEASGRKIVHQEQFGQQCTREEPCYKTT